MDPKDEPQPSVPALRRKHKNPRAGQAPPFTMPERIYLSKCCISNLSVVRGLGRTSNDNALRDKYWNELTESWGPQFVNGAQRKKESIQRKWVSQVSAAKAAYQKQRREATRTGGGAPPEPLDPDLEIIVEAFKGDPTFTGLGTFESGSPYDPGDGQGLVGFGSAAGGGTRLPWNAGFGKSGQSTPLIRQEDLRAALGSIQPPPPPSHSISHLMGSGGLLDEIDGGLLDLDSGENIRPSTPAAAASALAGTSRAAGTPGSVAASPANLKILNRVQATKRKKEEAAAADSELRQKTLQEVRTATERYMAKEERSEECLNTTMGVLAQMGEVIQQFSRLGDQMSDLISKASDKLDRF